MIVEPAPAKINLALHVRRRRPDGYHDLETLFAFATDGDVITVEESDRDSFHITGPHAAALHTSPERGGGPPPKAVVEGQSHAPSSDNLVTRARNAFRTLTSTPPVTITLTKNLPVASGIGGGSADAAATLRALARLAGIDPTDPRLHEIAATLGADVPACLAGRTALGTGKGDALARLDGLADIPLLLVNPNVAVSTAQVFARWDGIDRGPLPDGDLLARARAARNDLEPPAIALAPVIADVRALLDAAPGVILARMSGSGATCFALFEDDATRDAAVEAAIARGWWTLATRMG
jgi:4-diphosphocytidyl-2-C-methyl-D-erythritol kinase